MPRPGSTQTVGAPGDARKLSSRATSLGDAGAGRVEWTGEGETAGMRGLLGMPGLPLGEQLWAPHRALGPPGPRRAKEAGGPGPAPTPAAGEGLGPGVGGRLLSPCPASRAVPAQETSGRSEHLPRPVPRQTGHEGRQAARGWRPQPPSPCPFSDVGNDLTPLGCTDGWTCWCQTSGCEARAALGWSETLLNQARPREVGLAARGGVWPRCTWAWPDSSVAPLLACLPV